MTPKDRVIEAARKLLLDLRDERSPLNLAGVLQTGKYADRVELADAFKAFDAAPVEPSGLVVLMLDRILASAENMTRSILIDWLKAERAQLGPTQQPHPESERGRALVALEDCKSTFEGMLEGRVLNDSCVMLCETSLRLVNEALRTPAKGPE